MTWAFLLPFLLNIDNEYSEQTFDTIYKTTYTCNTKTPFLDLSVSISNNIISKVYVKQDNFDFDIVNFPFSDGDIPHNTSYEVYISQLIRFAKASDQVSDVF